MEIYSFYDYTGVFTFPGWQWLENLEKHPLVISKSDTKIEQLKKDNLETEGYFTSLHDFKCKRVILCYEYILCNFTIYFVFQVLTPVAVNILF